MRKNFDSVLTKGHRGKGQRRNGKEPSECSILVGQHDQGPGGTARDGKAKALSETSKKKKKADPFKGAIQKKGGHGNKPGKKSITPGPPKKQGAGKTAPRKDVKRNKILCGSAISK